MKIKKFRIRNYKSIIDSGDCYLEQDLTILAGKNESGKSSILEALADFNSKNAISENAIPIKDKNNLPEIFLLKLIESIKGPQKLKFKSLKIIQISIH
jgi:AAA15 family ATPase/GTPase